MQQAHSFAAFQPTQPAAFHPQQQCPPTMFPSSLATQPQQQQQQQSTALPPMHSGFSFGFQPTAASSATATSTCPSTFQAPFPATPAQPFAGGAPTPAGARSAQRHPKRPRDPTDPADATNLTREELPPPHKRLHAEASGEQRTSNLSLIAPRLAQPMEDVPMSMTPPLDAIRSDLVEPPSPLSDIGSPMDMPSSPLLLPAESPTAPAADDEQVDAELDTDQWTHRLKLEVSDQFQPILHRLTQAQAKNAAGFHEESILRGIQRDLEMQHRGNIVKAVWNKTGDYLNDPTSALHHRYANAGCTPLPPNHSSTSSPEQLMVLYKKPSSSSSSSSARLSSFGGGSSLTARGVGSSRDLLASHASRCNVELEPYDSATTARTIVRASPIVTEVDDDTPPTYTHQQQQQQTNLRFSSPPHESSPPASGASAVGAPFHSAMDDLSPSPTPSAAAASARREKRRRESDTDLSPPPDARATTIRIQEIDDEVEHENKRIKRRENENLQQHQQTAASRAAIQLNDTSMQDDPMSDGSPVAAASSSDSSAATDAMHSSVAGPPSTIVHQQRQSSQHFPAMHPHFPLAQHQLKHATAAPQLLALGQQPQQQPAEGALNVPFYNRPVVWTQPGTTMW